MTPTVTIASAFIAGDAANPANTIDINYSKKSISISFFPIVSSNFSQNCLVLKLLSLIATTISGKKY